MYGKFSETPDKICPLRKKNKKIPPFPCVPQNKRLLLPL
jgi:hypothetical protein